MSRSRKLPLGLARSDDGVVRCWWPGTDALYQRYHDEEWGVPVTDDHRLFEKVCLEGFQSGLSWLTILRKRDNFRAAFTGFDFDAVASFSERDVQRLLRDAGIVRNRAKIEATIANGKAVAGMAAEAESLAQLMWSFAPARSAAPTSFDDLASTTPESKAFAKELKGRGFRFIGPTTAYAAMQACGVVNDHLAGCAVRETVEA